jgi:hypothetical protein
MPRLFTPGAKHRATKSEKRQRAVLVMGCVSTVYHDSSLKVYIQVRARGMCVTGVTAHVWSQTPHSRTIDNPTNFELQYCGHRETQSRAR